MRRYRRGADFERKIKKLLEAEGWFVVRSAGSKGLVDLIAVFEGEIWAIQAKISGTSRVEEIKQLCQLARRHKFTPVFARKEGRETVLYNLFTGEVLRRW